MRKLFFSLSLAAMSFAASADDMVMRQGPNSLRLQQAPCTLPGEDGKPGEKAAVAILDGRQYRGCWVASGGIVSLRYEDGDVGHVRVESFTSEAGI
jgi:hypothetical protein